MVKKCKNCGHLIDKVPGGYGHIYYADSGYINYKKICNFCGCEKPKPMECEK